MCAAVRSSARSDKMRLHFLTPCHEHITHDRRACTGAICLPAATCPYPPMPGKALPPRFDLQWDALLQRPLAVIRDDTSQCLPLPGLRAADGQLPATRFDGLRMVVVEHHAPMLGGYDE